MSDSPVPPALPPSHLPAVLPPSVPPPAAAPTAGGKIVAWICVGLSALYLTYPSMSVFELIPDAVPIIGSLDEATATLLLLGALEYLGMPLPTFVANLFRRK